MTKGSKEKPQFSEFFVVERVEDFRLQLETLGTTGLALDIDDTISYTLKVWGKHLMEMFGNPEGLTVDEIFQKYGYFQNYWRDPEALAWMEAAINDDELQEEFDVIDNADIIVPQIHLIKPVLLYATNRPATVMRGTINWLKKKAFPKAGVIARPVGISQSEGYEWKAKILEYLYPYVEAVIDDNVKLIEKLPEDYKGKVYFFGHSNKPRNNIGVVPCFDWREVLDKME